MPYLVKGNAEQLFSAFGLSDFLYKSEARDIVEKDLPRTLFFGTEKEANVHLQAWRKEESSHYYTQGNMSAGNLQFLLGIKPFKKKGELDEEYHKHYVCHHFAYVNNEERPCGLMVAYRKDNPSQWLMGLVINTTAAPADREVILLSNIQLMDAIKSFHDGLSITVVLIEKNHFIDRLGLAVLQTLVRTVLNAQQGDIKINYERINLLLRTMVISQEKAILINPINCSELYISLLFAKEDPVLDFIVQKNIYISFTMLNDYLLSDSELHKELNGIELIDDIKTYRNLIQMTLVFYEEKTLESNRKFLSDHAFIRIFGGLMWDPKQITLLPFMLKEGYTQDLMQFILKEDIYYQALNTLVAMELAQKVGTLFENADKLSELQYIHGVADEATKRLCLVFWVKARLTLDGYKEIVAAAKKYPLMPETLVYLDKKGVVVNGIEGLKQQALKPETHLKESIAYHFFRGDTDQVYRKNLKELNPKELEAVSKALYTLKISETSPARDLYEYRLVLEHSKQGEGLRIFLPQIATHKNSSDRQVLINVLYKGVRWGIAEQGKTILAIENKEQQTLANDLRDRFICVKQLQDLEFDNKTITWAAQVDNKKSICFRQVIFQVEAQCKAIFEQLSSSVSTREMLLIWQEQEANYRKNLYKIAYNAFSNPKEFEKAKKGVQDLEKSILAIIDPPRDSKLHKAFVIITNIVIALLSLGVANYIKEKRTGNYWFFTQSKSGENVRALSKEIIRFIEPEEPNDGFNP